MPRPRIAPRVAELISSRRTAAAGEIESRQRLQQRQALVEAEGGRQLLSDVLRHLPVGVLIAEAPSGRLLLGNPAVERIWRQPLDEGAELADYGHYRGFRPDDRTPYGAADWPLARSVLAGETIERERIDILRGDGSFGTIEVSSTPVHSEEGALVAAVVLFDDVTESDRAERSLRLLARTGDLLDAPFDVAETIERITRLAVPALGDVCAAYLVDDGAATRIAVTSVDPSLDELVEDMRRRGPVDTSDPGGLIAQAIRESRSILVPDPLLEGLPELAEDAEQAALLGKLGAGATVVVPLRARGSALGALLIGVFGDTRPLSEDDIPLIDEIARRAGLALDNARTYSHEHRTAELLQLSLLPDRLPSLNGAEVTARYVASGTDEHVGGDWYDVIELPGGRTGLVIGDVAGHGVRAASAMGRLRNALRAFAMDGAGPAEVLRQLNVFERRLGESEMATLLYCVYDPADGELRYASAGHPWPLIVTAGGAVRRLEAARSVPVGVRPRATFEEASDRLDAGDTLLLYTDGLAERRDAPLDEGVARVERAAEHPAAGVDELCQNVLDAATRGTRPEDDLALLAFRVSPTPAARFELRLPAEPESLSALRHRLRGWLRAYDAAAGDVEEIVLACGEACANAVEHAYGPADAILEIEGAITGEEIELAIADSGRWRETRSEDRGLGLTIMRALMDEVSIDRHDRGTRVRMRRRFGEKVA